MFRQLHFQINRRNPLSDSSWGEGSSTEVVTAAECSTSCLSSVSKSSSSRRCRKRDFDYKRCWHPPVLRLRTVADYRGCCNGRFGRPLGFFLLLVLLFMDMGVNLGHCGPSSSSPSISSTRQTSLSSHYVSSRSSVDSQPSSMSGRSSAIPEHPYSHARASSNSLPSHVSPSSSVSFLSASSGVSPAEAERSLPSKSSSSSKNVSHVSGSQPSVSRSHSVGRSPVAHRRSSASRRSSPSSGKSSPVSVRFPSGRGRSSSASLSPVPRRSPGSRRSSPASRSSFLRGRSSSSRRSQSTKGRRQSEEDPLTSLSKVFGIKRIPANVVVRTPPQYMTDLYNHVADNTGLTKASGPYNASTVRSLPDRDTVHQEHFFYNVSHLGEDDGDGDEVILEAEFHIFKMKPRPAPKGEDFPPHHLLLKVHQVLDIGNMYSPGGLRQLDARRISTHAHGWFTFKVTKAVQAWLVRSEANHGLLVTAQSHQGRSYNGSYIRFAQRHQHHDSKQPILVVFTGDNTNRQPTYVSPDDKDYKEIREEMNRRNQQPRAGSRKGRQQRRRMRIARKEARNHGSPAAFSRNTKFRQDIRLLNERFRVHDAVPSEASTPASRVVRKRQKRASSSGSGSPSENGAEGGGGGGSGGGGGGKKKRKRQGRRKRTNDLGRYHFSRTCSRYKMYVDFDEIGWAGWIISPKGYDAYHCSGDCPFPLGLSQEPTNHATVQSIVHTLRVGRKHLGTPCCVPNKLFSISLLYFDDNENVILKRYDDMVAASCGCH